MKKRVTALTLILALCLAGCAGREEPPGKPEETPEVTAAPAPVETSHPFAMPYYTEASLHPITGDNRVNLTLSSLVYQGLFELDNTFTPQGVLCSSYTVSEDALTWTLTLTSAVFSDGSALTAADVAASLETARTSALYAARLAQISAVTANEDGTVHIALTTPNSALPALLDIPIVRETGGRTPLGTGPYAFAGSGDSLRLVRQSSAPDTAPEEIPLVPIEGADELIHAFDAGEVSLVTSDLTGADVLGYSAGYEADYPTTTLLYMGFRASAGPCKDALVRQAVSRALDRETVMVSLLAGHAVSTCLPFSPFSTLTSAEREQAGEYSPSAAADLLSQAGYAAGEDGLLYYGRSALSLTMIVNTDNSFKLVVAEYLTGQLQNLGISVELKKLTWDEYLNALEKGNFDLYLGEVTLTADFDLTPLLAHTGALNYGGYSSAEMETLLTQLRTASESGRTQAASELLALFQTDMPLAPLCFKSGSVLTQWGAITGLQPTRQDPFYHIENLRFGAQPG